MLVVDPDKRFTIDQCLAHPWLTQTPVNINDSTGGLVGGIASLEVNRRAPKRERTLLASINEVDAAEQFDAGTSSSPIKVFAKKPARVTNVLKEQAPAHHRATQEFMGLGGKGDQQLYVDEESSIQGKAKGKGGR